MAFPPKFEDDPEARKRVWETAPRAVDKYGNKLIKIGQYWCSFDPMRLRQIARECEKDDWIVVVRVSDGRFFSKRKTGILAGNAGWQKRLKTGWYCFVDPEVQQVYQ